MVKVYHIQPLTLTTPLKSVSEVLKLMQWCDVLVPSDIIIENKTNENIQMDKSMSVSIAYYKPKVQQEPIKGLDYDIAFVGSPSKQFYKNINVNQCINHFIGMEILVIKRELARTLNKMRKKYPKEYNFFPQTWLLPQNEVQLNEFINNNNNNNNDIWFIIKADSSSRGNGMYLTTTPLKVNIEEEEEEEEEEVDHNNSNNDTNMKQKSRLIQEYIIEPCLIDSKKFDMRLYVLITSVTPLRIYVYRNGLARFCTEDYILPNNKNSTNRCMFLTNYAVNKESVNFKEGTKQDTKRELKDVLKRLEDMGISLEQLWNDIDDIIIKAILPATSLLEHNYRVMFPGDHNGGRCFELLGVDIMLDKNGRPYLLEMNRNCNILCDTDVDKRVKYAVLEDMFHLIDPTVVKLKSNNQITLKEKKQINNNNNKIKSSPPSYRGRPQLSRVEKRNQLKYKINYELETVKNTQFDCIFPIVKDIDRYDELKKQFNLSKSKCIRQAANADETKQIHYFNFMKR